MTSPIEFSSNSFLKKRADGRIVLSSYIDPNQGETKVTEDSESSDGDGESPEVLSTDITLDSVVPRNRTVGSIALLTGTNFQANDVDRVFLSDGSTLYGPYLVSGNLTVSSDTNATLVVPDLPVYGDATSGYNVQLRNNSGEASNWLDNALVVTG